MEMIGLITSMKNLMKSSMQFPVDLPNKPGSHMIWKYFALQKSFDEHGISS